MKIIKKIALFALFTNVAYSADLPEDHPLTRMKQSVDLIKSYIFQEQLRHVDIDYHTVGKRINDTEAVKSHSFNIIKSCVDTFFTYDYLPDIFKVHTIVNECMLPVTFLKDEISSHIQPFFQDNDGPLN